MQSAGWTSMNVAQDTFRSWFTVLATKVAPSSMYLVCAKQDANEIAHMIVVTTSDSVDDAFVTDAQKQSNNYGVYRYVAWRYGAADAVPEGRPEDRAIHRAVDLAELIGDDRGRDGRACEPGCPSSVRSAHR
ncbi:MAG: hypothetical protein H7125_15375 [Proteobacteria bacterium]|nr:hypothetical protein [Burkholderiales bacterium]